MGYIFGKHRVVLRCTPPKRWSTSDIEHDGDLFRINSFMNSSGQITGTQLHYILFQKFTNIYNRYTQVKNRINFIAIVTNDCSNQFFARFTIKTALL